MNRNRVTNPNNRKSGRRLAGSVLTGILLAVFMLLATGIPADTAARPLPEAAHLQDQLTDLFLTESGRTVEEPRVSLNLRDIPLIDALHMVAGELGVGISINTRDIEGRRVTYQSRNRGLYDVLHDLLAETNLEVGLSRDNKTLIIWQREETAEEALSLFQQTVTGRVTDLQTGESIPGANILIQGTSSGTTTDLDGTFELAVPDLQQTLVVSYIGYTSRTIPLEGRSTLNVELAPSVTGLEEVVVTAFGIARQRASLGYSVTEIDGSNLTQIPENNLGNALTGRIAGVNASGSATGPGGSSRVVIRGNGSLSGNNQPLYIVNGVPINNANQGSAGTYGGKDLGDGLISINPDDIESVTVLKGGTAAALYGSRASNGVILIETKSGRGSRGIGVEYNSTLTFENPLVIPDWQYEYGSGSRGVAPTSQAEAIANGRISWGSRLDGSMVVQPDGVARPYVAQKDNIRNFYDTGTALTNTIALSGGSQAASFRFSVSDLNNRGIVPNSTIRRNTFNLSANANLSEKVIFEGTAQYNIEEARNRTAIADFTGNPNASVGLVATNIDVRTLAPGYDENGYETHWSDYVFVSNPYFAINKRKNEDTRNRFLGSFSLRYNITDYLFARARLGVDYFHIQGKDITPTGTLHNPDGSMSTRRSINSETNAEALIGFEKEFGAISVNALAGGNRMQEGLSGVSFSSGNFNVPFAYFLTNGSSPTFSESFRESAINSLFGSAEIGFNRYLYLTVSGRQDWFSTLPMESNSLFYPSVGLSFIFTDVWNSRPRWLDYGRIRTSWAQVGGGAPNPYGLTLTYRAESSSHLGQPLMSIAANNIPNSSLKPYTSTTLEAGLETRLFDNRWGVDITVYDRTTTDDIVSTTLPRPASYGGVLVNVGEVQNRGVELLVTTTPVRNNVMNWNVSLNAAYNENKVKRIADGIDSIVLSTARTNNGFVHHFEGMPFGMVAGFKYARDANGNIVYDPASGMPVQGEFAALGRGVPPLTMGVNNEFRYRDFSLGVLIDGKFGSKMYVSTDAYGTYYGKHKRTVENGVREKGIQVSGVDLDGNPWSATVDAQDYYQHIAFSITEEFVSGADFIKLRQISFGYTLPESVLARTPLQYVRFSIVGRNLLMLYSQMKNVDPESNYNTGNGQGLENFGVPPTRSFGFNLSIGY